MFHQEGLSASNALFGVLSRTQRPVRAGIPGQVGSALVPKQVAPRIPDQGLRRANGQERCCWLFFISTGLLTLICVSQQVGVRARGRMFELLFGTTPLEDKTRSQLCQEPSDSSTSSPSTSEASSPFECLLKTQYSYITCGEDFGAGFYFHYNISASEMQPASMGCQSFVLPFQAGCPRRDDRGKARDSHSRSRSRSPLERRMETLRLN